MPGWIPGSAAHCEPLMTDLLKRLSAEPLGFMGLFIVTVVLLSALLADFLAPYDPVALNLADRLQGPSTMHWLGTDQLGRDLLSRVLYGGRIALKVALIAISVALLVGVSLGMIAGFGPRWLDHLIMIFFDTIRSFPTVMFALATVALVGPSLSTVILVIVVTSIPNYGRVVRTQTLSIRAHEFIKAEQVMGASALRLLGVHVLPNVVGPLLILASMDIPTVIALEAGLSFLGMGVKPPTPSWGSILNDGYTLIRNTPWPIIAGSIPLILVTLGFTFLGESLRDQIDPKMRSTL